MVHIINLRRAGAARVTGLCVRVCLLSHISPLELLQRQRQHLKCGGGSAFIKWLFFHSEYIRHRLLAFFMTTSNLGGGGGGGGGLSASVLSVKSSVYFPLT